MEKKGLSGSNLKFIAMISMLIDHIGATILYRYFMSAGLMTNDINADITSADMIYMMFRVIGRLAFPIYIFLLIEGFMHTRSVIKYLLRLLVFAFISEPFFDMAFCIQSSRVKQGVLIEFGYQNVFFTLFLGLVIISLMDIWIRKVKNQYIGFIGCILVCGLGMVAAYALHTDYGAVGVLAIAVAYIAKAWINSDVAVIVCSAIVLSFNDISEVFALLNIPVIRRYNHSRGKNIKPLFYAFYPVHLFVLGVICIMFGI